MRISRHKKKGSPKLHIRLYAIQSWLVSVLNSREDGWKTTLGILRNAEAISAALTQAERLLDAKFAHECVRSFPAPAFVV